MEKIKKNEIWPPSIHLSPGIFSKKSEKTKHMEKTNGKKFKKMRFGRRRPSSLAGHTQNLFLNVFFFSKIYKIVIWSVSGLSVGLRSWKFVCGWISARSIRIWAQNCNSSKEKHRNSQNTIWYIFEFFDKKTSKFLSYWKDRCVYVVG